MQDLALNEQLGKENIFELFKLQVQKDFEGAGLEGDFAAGLPFGYEPLLNTLTAKLAPFLQKNSNKLMSLLYRIDISQEQIRKYRSRNPQLAFEATLAELIIKRTLQKVILKKSFSK